MLKKIVQYSALILLLIPLLIVWFTHQADTQPSNELGGDADQVAHSRKAEKDNTKGRKIKYWVAPMDPNYIRNEPGKSPMGMDLVPVYEDEDEKSSEGIIRIDPVTVQTIGVRTATVSLGQLKKSIRAAGRIAYDERLVEHIHTKVAGWVEKLHVQTTGEEVKKGQELLTFYSPELVSTQEEYLQALQYRDKTASSIFTEVAESGSSLVEASKKRLQFMDIDSAQIEALERSGKVLKNMTLKSGRKGTVINKNVLEGMKVDPMMELYTIADLSKVWVIASIYEYELPFLETGQDVEMTLAYDPGTTYRGKITFIYPFLSSKTRTVEVRMEFDNPRFKLKPDMYVDVEINVEPSGPELLVPSEAVIRTGSRNVVITALEKGKFLPKEVTVGLEGEGFVQILDGLNEDETVITSGQFLIDSESNLREAVNKMLKPSAGAPAESGLSTKKADNQQESQAAKSTTAISDDQKKILSDLLEHYLIIHSALIAESSTVIAEKTHEMHSVFEKLRDSDTEGSMKEITDAIDASLEGLHSGDLQTARASFKMLSRTMTEIVKGVLREDALAEGIKIYFCSMENEPWIQKGTELKNPYLGQDMWICGVEEKY